MRAESACAFGTSDIPFAATSSAVKPITVNPLAVPSKLFLTRPSVRLFSKHPCKCRIVGDMGGCIATVTAPSFNNQKTVCRAARRGGRILILLVASVHVWIFTRLFAVSQNKTNKWRHPNYAPTQVICATVSCLLKKRSTCMFTYRSATRITIHGFQGDLLFPANVCMKLESGLSIPPGQGTAGEGELAAIPGYAGLPPLPPSFPPCGGDGPSPAINGN